MVLYGRKKYPARSDDWSHLAWLSPVPCYLETLFRKKDRSLAAFVVTSSCPPCPPCTMILQGTQLHCPFAVLFLPRKSSDLFWILWHPCLCYLPGQKNSLPGVPENEGLFSFLCFKPDLLLPSLSAIQFLHCRIWRATVSHLAFSSRSWFCKSQH